MPDHEPIKLISFSTWFWITQPKIKHALASIDWKDKELLIFIKTEKKNIFLLERCILWKRFNSHEHQNTILLPEKIIIDIQIIINFLAI